MSQSNVYRPHHTLWELSDRLFNGRAYSARPAQQISRFHWAPEEVEQAYYRAFVSGQMAQRVAVPSFSVLGGVYAYTRTARSLAVCEGGGTEQVLVEQCYHSGQLTVGRQRFPSFHMAGCLTRLAIKEDGADQYQAMYDIQFPTSDPDRPTIEVFDREQYGIAPTETPPGRAEADAIDYLSRACMGRIAVSMGPSFDALAGPLPHMAPEVYQAEF